MKMCKIISVFAFMSVAALAFAGGNKEKPKEINVSYVESPFNLQIMVMKERGMLESNFAAKNIKVKWHEINSGADQTQAMAANSLDIGSVVNSTSVIMANAAGNPVEVAAIVSRPKQSFALMTGANGPKTIKDLKGKRIAGPKGTVLHQILVAALTANGMKIGDVQFISMAPPAAMTALLSGQVDAGLLAAALILRSEEAGCRQLFSADGFTTPLLLTAVRPSFAKNSPELLDIYLKTQKQAYDWILANPAEAIAIGAALQQVSPADGKKLYDWSGMAATMQQSDIDEMKNDVSFLLDQEMIAATVDPATFILPVALK